MKVPLAKVIKILNEASSVIFGDDGALVYLSMDEHDLTGDPENQFMYVEWNDEQSNTHFNEGENQEVEVVGTSLFLVDYEGDTFQINPLFPKDLEHECSL